MIDLHVHSTFSDGSLTPEQLVASAREIGLTALALTDHDCTSGIERFMAACADGDGSGLRGIPGVEISADVKGGTMHLLGYYVDTQDAELERTLDLIRDGREFRNHKILARLNELGLPMTWEEVSAFAGEDVVGRPHFAQALLSKGYISTKQEAFDSYLAKGKPAYVDRFRLSPSDSVAAIRSAGGVPVLAHPYTLQLGDAALRSFVTELKEAGLAGIEVYYSEHSSARVKAYLALAADRGLLVTGGSDFHGEANSEVALGTGRGGLAVPDELADELQRYARSV